LSGRRNTASRSQRESNPISLPPASTTQSRFTPATVNVRAAVRTPTVALIAAAGVVITSPAVIPDDFRQRPRVARLASGGGPPAPPENSSLANASFAETMPTGTPATSTTGSGPHSISVLITAMNGVSGHSGCTGLVITVSTVGSSISGLPPSGLPL